VIWNKTKLAEISPLGACLPGCHCTGHHTGLQMVTEFSELRPTERTAIYDKIFRDDIANADSAVYERLFEVNVHNQE